VRSRRATARANSREGNMKTLIAGKILHLATGAALALLLTTTSPFAQDKQKFFFKAPTGITKFTQQHTIEIGDRPGHVLRLLEAHTKYAAEAPEYAGVKAVEMWNRSIVDVTEGTGPSIGYQVILLASGDKIFGRTDNMTHTIIGADGSRKSTFHQVITFAGGTGKFVGMRGTLRTVGAVDLRAGTSNVESEGEYWIEK
jgi:hypothetical protein